MFWHEVDFEKISVDDKNNITYNGGDEFRFQIPSGYTLEGIDEWSRISIHINSTEFFEWFTSLENYLGKTEPYVSLLNIEQSTIGVKIVDDFTQIFNNQKVISESKLTDCTLYTIIEISKKYGPFKDRYGLVCKAYQIVFIENECAFT